MKNKNLVMGVAKGYSWYSLEPFVNSCKKFCPDADLVLFVDDLSAFTLNRLQAANVKVLPIPEDLKSKIIVCSRFVMYQNFLEENPAYQNIFVSDVRDVVFQENVFAKYSKYKNFLVYATEAKTIRDEPVNTGWIKRLFGDEEYNKIADNRVICAGTILGSRAAMQTFFEMFNARIQDKPNWGDDQSTVNYLVRNNLLPIENLIESGVDTGEILTVGILQNPQIANGKILRGDGNFPAVVHQYTPHDNLNQLVHGTFHDNNFLPDGNFIDFQSSFDQVFSLAHVQNWSVATKLFIAYVFYNPNLNFAGDKILTLNQLILSRYTPDAEILLSAAQKKLADAFNQSVTVTHMEKIYRVFVQSEQVNVLNSQFKNFIKQKLFAFVDVFYRGNRRDSALEYVRRLANWRD